MPIVNRTRKIVEPASPRASTSGRSNALRVKDWGRTTNRPDDVTQNERLASWTTASADVRPLRLAASVFHVSYGTKRTCSLERRMSVVGGRTDLTGNRRHFRV